MKVSFISVVLLGIVSMSACGSGGGGGNGNTTPNQNAVNAGVNDLTLNAINDIAIWLDIIDCQALTDFINDTLNNPPPPTDCGDGGTFQNTPDNNLVCNDGPPMTFTFSYTHEEVDCTATGLNTTVDGTYTVDVDIDGEAGSEVLNDAGLVINGINFVFNSLTVSVDSSGNASCSGTITVDGFECQVSSNCQTCPL